MRVFAILLLVVGSCLCSVGCGPSQKSLTESAFNNSLDEFVKDCNRYLEDIENVPRTAVRPDIYDDLKSQYDKFPDIRYDKRLFEQAELCKTITGYFKTLSSNMKSVFESNGYLATGFKLDDSSVAPNMKPLVSRSVDSIKKIHSSLIDSLKLLQQMRSNN